MDVTLPDQWIQRWPGYGGTVWYRIAWRNPCEPATGVTLASLSQAGAFYLNDTLLWRDTNLEEPLSRSANMPRYWVLPASSLQAGENLLWFRVTGVEFQAPGLGKLQLGDPATLLAQHQEQTWMQRGWLQADVVVSATLSVLSLLVWLLYRRAREFGWFALLTASWVAFAGTLLMTSPWPFPDTATLERFFMSALVVYAVCFCLFTWTFAGLTWRRALQALLILAAAMLLTHWLIPIPWLGYSSLSIFLLCSLLILGNALLLQWPLWRKRNFSRVLLAIWLLAVLVVGVHDLIAVLFFPARMELLTPYTGVATLLCMGVIMALRVARDLRRITRFNQELQERVDAARAELQAANERQLLVERERSRLKARMDLTHDLHDGLGSSLMRAMGSVQHAPAPMSNDAFLGYLKVLRNDLRQILDAEAGSQAKAPGTPSQWLAPIRHRFGMLFDELAMDALWNMPDAWPWQPEARHCMALARVLEEALTNIVKHSKATEVCVELNALPASNGMQLHIRDNGRGFDAALMETAGMGIGLQSMRARIERLGGTWQLDSGEQGTHIRITLPDMSPENAAT